MTEDSNLDFSFIIQAESVSLRPIGEFRVLDIEGPVVLVDDAAYRFEDLRELDVSDVRAALEALSDDNDFQTSVDNSLTNTPLVYDDIDYLTNDFQPIGLHQFEYTFHVQDDSLSLLRQIQGGTFGSAAITQVVGIFSCFLEGAYSIEISTFQQRE
ncbi:hypothetical protein [Natrialba swarupiae]|uniref:Uncharacterized protein n=1 Tax=Natrialba swarupiae TaxID=2448032 RepID=A0A5D5ALL4_9EURY|nr:hypothetical protein [Natrialba swarupiae]TYT61737.1 hypothetical protein FYC77_11940 [Natrialba swarupiae]